MVCLFCVEFDCECFGLVMFEGIGGFGDCYVFVGVGIKDVYWFVVGYQCVEGFFECGFVGWVVFVFGEIVGELWEYEGYGSFLVGGDERWKYVEMCF